ncbi:phosphonopyruvate decarboxylase [Agrobacterium fabrum]|uniref:phosphonopyruvate decarboxylase n=1 Tax=Agrobacterium fabrum TaxID=1176649 RepID=UPI003BA03F68
MISAKTFLSENSKRGLDFYCGVPCSFLTPVINELLRGGEQTYVGATSEGEAVAIAAGAWLAGRDTVVMCQNSGLGNAVNPIASLNAPFRIPTMMIITWRGEPGSMDEPQHELMGQITHSLLNTLQVQHRPFPASERDLPPSLQHALRGMHEERRSFAFVATKEAFAPDADIPFENPRSTSHGRRIDLMGGDRPPSRIDILAALLDQVPADYPIVASTGKAGRELFTLQDRDQHLYLVGSMGCASAVGLGIAHASGLPTIIVDGDGAALMKLGNMASIGAYRPGGLVHILLDNGVHDSTGGQPTASSSVDFAAIAVACGYPLAFSCDSLAGFRAAFRQAIKAAGPILIHARIRPGSIPALARPTIAPHDVASRLRTFIRNLNSRSTAIS